MINTGLCEKRATAAAGNALFCTAAVISPGSVIRSFDSYITAHSVVSDEHLRRHLRSLDFSELPLLNEKLVLTLYLAIYCPRSANSRARSCEHRSDINELPTSLQSSVWTREDLTGTQINAAIAAKQRLLERQWQALASGICTFEDFKWAESIISSRSIGLAEARPICSTPASPFSSPGYSSEEVTAMFDLPAFPNLALVPTLDLCNHAGNDRNARWDFASTAEEPVSTKTFTQTGQSAGRLCLFAVSEIKKGQEITISYGDEKTNEELFFTYNFYIPGNPNWSVSLEMPVPPDAFERDDIPGERYWAAVAKTHGITRFVRFTNSDYLNPPLSSSWKDDEEGHPRVIRRYSQPGKLKISPQTLCTVLLSHSAYPSSLLERLFNDNDSDFEDRMNDEEIETSNSFVEKVLDNLIRSRVELITVKLADIENEVGIRQMLLEDEIRGLKAVAIALAGLNDE